MLECRWELIEPSLTFHLSLEIMGSKKTASLPEKRTLQVSFLNWKGTPLCFNGFPAEIFREPVQQSSAARVVRVIVNTAGRKLNAATKLC
jgi:hypothetical protein